MANSIDHTQYRIVSINETPFMTGEEFFNRLDSVSLMCAGNTLAKIEWHKPCEICDKWSHGYQRLIATLYARYINDMDTCADEPTIAVRNFLHTYLGSVCPDYKPANVYHDLYALIQGEHNISMLDITKTMALKNNYMGYANPIANNHVIDSSVIFYCVEWII